MKTQCSNNRYCAGVAIAIFASVLVGCRTTESASTSPPSTPSSIPSPAATAPQTNAAILSEIQKQPVWVKPENAQSEVPGKQGMALKVGETIRTEGEALAQVELNSGLAFRIGGDAVLTLQPNNKLYLNSGEMITWVQPGQKVPAEIVTPGGIAGIRGTTVYVKIPKNPEEGTLFFSWEGSVAVRLPDLAEEIVLESGQEILIPKAEKDIAKLRALVRQLPLEEWRKRRQTSNLMGRFSKPLPTLSKLEEVEQKLKIPPSPRDNPRQER
ncbi:FecR family protein [Oscillatoria sp. FACHB-1406]|uniref:FecR family protein n=1 Tax=Oscillatoria sp. FACHB-1406 TaxID=2692846 RepID=UPI0016870197|nr:FecR family protein [Oscillatoria sp. FACHB-1406]MBD2577864.1 FecR domain-containing protein [Oscillatoria sp. FACHB-1406]